MKHSIFFFFDCKLKITTIIFFLLLGYKMTGQNASYNLNSIPISGTQNSAFGFQALFSNSTGGSNTAMGYSALSSNTAGSFNVGIGKNALLSNTSGYNTAIGAGSLSQNTGGLLNTASGFSSLSGNTTGLYNTANGANTLQTNTTGTYNTALGNLADVGSGNLTNTTAIGNGAIVNASNTIQLGNSSITAIYAGTGTNATLIAGGLQVTGGSIAAGKVLTSDAFGNATWQTPAGSSGWSLTGNAGTVDGVNFIGTTDNIPFNIRVNNQQAGRIDPTIYNTFYGVRAGLNNTTGSLNTGIGTTALTANTTGYDNTAIGGNALFRNTTGNGNTAVGMAALDQNTVGISNIAIGASSLFTNTTGYWNTAIGTTSLDQNTSGIANTADGMSALITNTTGRFNTGLGYSADVSSGSLSNATAVGSLAIVNASNKIRLGDVNVTVVEGPVAYTISDGRFKNNINEDDVKGLAFINRLRPVVYNFNTRKFEEFLTRNIPDSIRDKYFVGKDFESSSSIRQSGFIAQEVEIAAKESGYTFNGVHVPESIGDNYSLAYSQFVVPLVKAVQELSIQNDKLKEDNKQLLDQLNKLTNRVTALENIKMSAMQPLIINETANLEQNVPNPFTNNTVIRYNVPLIVSNAKILITDKNGITIKSISLTNKGVGQIVITAGTLAAGNYFYSLIIDGKKMDSKQMVLTK